MTFRLPHPLVLLLGAVAIATLLTHVVPAGKYERRLDAESGRQVVVPGTYAPVEHTPVGPAAALMAVPEGILAGADVIVTILFVGGTFALLEATGALSRLIGALVGRSRRPRLILVLVSLVFVLLGALENTQEELIALTPVMVVLSRGLGFGAVTALAMSVGAACVGSAFGPTNPFQTGIALRFAEVQGLSQPALRFGLFAAAVAVWIGWTLLMTRRDDVRPEVRLEAGARPTGRDVVMLSLVLLPFLPYVYGVLRWNWGFNELSAIFLVAGLLVGLVDGRGLSGSASGFLKAMETVLAAGLFIGVARAISVVLTKGQVLDTILFSMAAPLAGLPGALAGILMVPVHVLLHIPVPTVSGQAVLSMPVMAPLADLVGISRDAAVIAYQTGAGLSDVVVPTNGAVLAILMSAQVSYGRWLRFAVPGLLLVAVVGVVGIVLAG